MLMYILFLAWECCPCDRLLLISQLPGKHNSFRGAFLDSSAPSFLSPALAPSTVAVLLWDKFGGAAEPPFPTLKPKENYSADLTGLLRGLHFKAYARFMAQGQAA